MPRRLSKKPKGIKPRPTKKSNASLNRWETVDDIPQDEQDAFHASRDEVLLDGDTYGGSDDGDDDEVFTLTGLETHGDEEDYDEGLEGQQNDIIDSASPITAKPSKREKKKKKRKQQELSDDNEEEQEEESWGRGKTAYYSSNAAQLESDDEEGQELEEQEARRLQQKALEGMSDDDFGLNDKHEISRTSDPLEGPPEISTSVKPPLPQDRRSLLRHLEKTNPEALALARDWDDTVTALMKTRKRISQLQSTEHDLSMGMAHLHFQALLTYATTLAFYLYLRASTKYAKRPELLTSHPIMRRLLTLKQSVSTLEDLGFTLSDSEPEFDEDDNESLDLTDGEDAKGMWRMERNKGLESGELDELLKDAQMSVSFVESKPRSIVVQPLESKPPKKKRKLSPESLAVPKTPIFDLEEPEFASSKTKSRSRADRDQDDAYGEATYLQFIDAADKSARKKSLRFHTSKIEGTSARRQGARNQAIGGDDDIPYRERQKDKEVRLPSKAKSKVESQGGEDLDDSEPVGRTSEKRRRVEESDVEDESDDYYELIKRTMKEKREQKQAEYDAARAAERVIEKDTSSGPRSLTRAILTNKGLTPHRPKAVRNPRVKKRLKFEKAKKKLASQKAVYKGGLLQAGGHYNGEKSGISKVVKSVRLG